MGLRISDSKRVGPVRLRVSAPLTGRGRTWESLGFRFMGTWINLSRPVKKRRH